MPIRPENRERYPADWGEISKRIRFARAEGRCECRGECGIDHALERTLFRGFVVRHSRCFEQHGEPHTITGSIVVLTTAHLDHTPEHCDDDNLRAMCQRCHLSYDRPRHVANARENRRRRRALRDLFGGPTEAELAAAKAATGLMRARK